MRHNRNASNTGWTKIQRPSSFGHHRDCQTFFGLSDLFWGSLRESSIFDLGFDASRLFASPSISLPARIRCHYRSHPGRVPTCILLFVQCRMNLEQPLSSTTVVVAARTSPCVSVNMESKLLFSLA
jgi:hypothetical protein